MPKNKGKGGKTRRKGKNNTVERKRDLVLKEEGQEYARIKKLLGGCRMQLLCFDGVLRLGIVRGCFRRRVWMQVDDIVLVGLRSYEDSKCDIIHKYTADDVRLLVAKDHLPKHTKPRSGDEALDEEDPQGWEFAVSDEDQRSAVEAEEESSSSETDDAGETDSEGDEDDASAVDSEEESDIDVDLI
eukprot:TRINITY_DN97420_c0_g1_i1.p1 TRINITY_DN97420_c0_g1~~TRINITY_DN97420_c0_g1_i1.p1  ORF type:complete len:186 (+),score=25.19 TRINITY_DN97420_c0_g1_i1:82-639(+)